MVGEERKRGGGETVGREGEDKLRIDPLCLLVLRRRLLWAAGSCVRC